MLASLFTSLISLEVTRSILGAITILEDLFRATLVIGMLMETLMVITLGMGRVCSHRVVISLEMVLFLEIGFRKVIIGIVIRIIGLVFHLNVIYVLEYDTLLPIVIIGLILETQGSSSVRFVEKRHIALECYHRNNFTYQGSPPPPSLTVMTA